METLALDRITGGSGVGVGTDEFVDLVAKVSFPPDGFCFLIRKESYLLKGGVEV